MSSSKKKKRSESSPLDDRASNPLSISDITVSNIELLGVKKKKKKKAPVDGEDYSTWYRVLYSVLLTSPHEKKEIKVATTKGIMENPSEAMMEKTRDAINSKVVEWGIDCSVGAGPLFMTTDTIWEYLCVYAENEIHKMKNEAEARSAKARKGHETRANAVVGKEWEEGSDFKDRGEKHRAKAAVMSALEQHSQKETAKAEPILSSIITDLSNVGLREEEVVSNATKQKIATTNAMIESASSLVKHMTKKMTKKSARVLTGLCAILAPQPSSSNDISMRDFADVLNRNRQSGYSYMKKGFEKA